MLGRRGDGDTEELPRRAGRGKEGGGFRAGASNKRTVRRPGLQGVGALQLVMVAGGGEVGDARIATRGRGLQRGIGGGGQADVIQIPVTALQCEADRREKLHANFLPGLGVSWPHHGHAHLTVHEVIGAGKIRNGVDDGGCADSYFVSRAVAVIEAER